MQRYFLAVAMGGLLIVGCETTGANKKNNSLMTPAASTPAVTFERRAQAIDARATKDSSDPTCQNIRANYYAQLEALGTDENGQLLGSMQEFSGTTNSAGSSVSRIGARIDRSATAGARRTLGKGMGTLNDATAIAGDVASLGGLFKADPRKKAEKLDEEAMEAAELSGCPMSTFA